MHVVKKNKNICVGLLYNVLKELIPLYRLIRIVLGSMKMEIDAFAYVNIYAIQ